MILYLPGKQTPLSIRQLLPRLRNSPKLNVLEKTTVKEVVESLNSMRAGLVISVVSDKQELTQLANFLAMENGRIKEGFLRTIIINLINNPKIPAFLRSKGCSVVMDSATTAKALMLRIQQGLEVLEQRREQAQENAVREPAKPSKAGNVAASVAAKRREVVWIPALKNDADYWLVEKKADIRSVIGRWLIQLMGPSTNVGAWVPADIRGHEGSAFLWKPNDSTENRFALPGVQWVFFGQMPEFNWNTHRWKFVSNGPKLVLFKDGKPILSRIDYQSPGKVIVAENSVFAKQRRLDIEATFLMEIKNVADKKKAKKTNENTDDHAENKARDTVEKKAESSQETSELELTAKEDEEGELVYIDRHEKVRKAPNKAQYFEKDRENSKPDWNENIGEDDEAPEWNQHDSEEDPEAPEWNDLLEEEEKAGSEINQHDLSDPKGKDWGGKFERENVFDSGRGLGQGQGKEGDGYDYDEDDFSGLATGDEAFASIELKIFVVEINAGQPCPQTPVLLLENDENQVLIDAPLTHVRPKASPKLRIVANIEDPELNFDLSGEVTLIEDLGDGRGIATIKVEGKNQKALKSFRGTFERRQKAVEVFMKAARGR